MSRSYRHTPVCGITTARSEKDDKRLLNRIWRSRVRSRLNVARNLHAEAMDGFFLPDDHNDILSRWIMAKDGRQRFDPDALPRHWPRWKAMGK